MPTLAEYPLRSHEKLRYADTDRQGHVNNSVFATMLETGRAELLYAEPPLHETGCTFVIASLHLDFLGEINWPSTVDIGTRIAKVGKSSLSFEQALFQTGHCVATAKTVIVQMNEATRRSHPLPESTVHILSGLMKVVT